MNRINASEREKVAAQFEGDAQRILIVERAKARRKAKDYKGRVLPIKEEKLQEALRTLLKFYNGVILTHKKLQR